MIEHDYVALKLMNGDNVIAVLVDEDDNRFIIMYPIQMKSVKVTLDGSNKEILTGSPWCSFTDDQVYQIWKTDVIIIKPLNESTIEYYKKMVDDTEVKNYQPENEEDELEPDIDEDSFFIPGDSNLH